MGIFNSVIEIGRLTKNAEMKMSAKGFPIVSFSIGVSELQKSENGEFTTRSNFFDVVMFGKYGQTCMQSLTKGREVAIRGRLKQERWEKGGQTFSKIVIYADDLQILREPKNHESAELPQNANLVPQFKESDVLQDPIF